MKTTHTSQHGPLVTVLISTYNRPLYLREALASIVSQTWPHIEIILVRDGGVPVREVIADFLDDPRLRFIDRDQNRGLPYSFNEALGYARGEYVCYLGDDDVFYPFHVETLLRAMLAQDRCQVVYGDLYKAHCRVLPDGRRIVLAKNVEISRDFDRTLMLQFNHALHVSLLHRRDLLDKTGLYNETLNVMIDWDLTRRLCFYTDFLHVPVVTGEYYAPVGDCDRISVTRRKNVSEYLLNVLTIRSTRPAKPWPCMHDLSVIVLDTEGVPAQMVRDLWSHSFYPNQFYVPLSPAQLAAFKTRVPNVIPVPVPADASLAARVDAALQVCDGTFAALVPAGLTVSPAEAAFLERSLYPLFEHEPCGVAYELVESTPEAWGAVLHKEELVRARQAYGQLSVPESLRAAGIELRKPTFKDYPFQCDNYLNTARQQCREGDWGYASHIYDYVAGRFGNRVWMQTLKANALYQSGRLADAAALIGQLNQTHPTVSRLMLEARARRKLNDFAAAAALYRRAEAILDGTTIEYPQDRLAVADASGELPRLQESHLWTS